MSGRVRGSCHRAVRGRGAPDGPHPLAAKADVGAIDLRRLMELDEVPAGRKYADAAIYECGDADIAAGLCVVPDGDARVRRPPAISTTMTLPSAGRCRDRLRRLRGDRGQYRRLRVANPPRLEGPRRQNDDGENAAATGKGSSIRLKCRSIGPDPALTGWC